MNTSELFGTGYMSVPNPLYKKGSKKQPQFVQTNDPFEKIKAQDNTMANAIALSNAQHSIVDTPKNYEELKDKDIAFNTTDLDFNDQLAEKQGIGEQIGRTLYNTLWGNLIVGTGKFLGDIAGGIMHVAGIAPTYNNILSNKLEEAQNETAQDNQVYVRDDAPIYDPSYILSKVPMVASIASMGIATGAATKAITALGKATGVGRAIKNARIWGSTILANDAKVAKAAEAIAKGNASIANAGKTVENAATQLNKFGQWANKPNVIALANGAAMTAGSAVINRLMWNYSEAHSVFNQMYQDASQQFSDMDDETYNAIINKNANALDEAGIDVNDRDAVAKFIAKQSADRTFNFDWSNALFDLVTLYGTRNILKGINSNAPSIRALKLQRAIKRFPGLNEAETVKAMQNLSKWEKFKDWGYGARIGLTRSLIHQPMGIAQMAVVGLGSDIGLNYGKSLMLEAPESSWDNRLENYLSNPETYEELFWAGIGGMASGAAMSGIGRAYRHIDNKYRIKQYLKDNPNPNEEQKTNINKARLFGNMTAQEKYEAAVILKRQNDFAKLVSDLNDVNHGKDPYVTDGKNKAELKTEEKDGVINRIIDDYTSKMVLDAADTGQIGLLEDYLKTEEVKQALADKAGFDKADLDSRQQRILDKIKNTKEKYNKYYSIVSTNLAYIEQDRRKETKDYNKGKKGKARIHYDEIPAQYANIIAKHLVKLDNELEVNQRQYDQTKARVQDRISELQNSDNPQLDKGVDYLQVIKSVVDSQRLGRLYAEKDRLNRRAKDHDANLASINYSLSNINKQIDLIEGRIKPKDDTAASIAQYLFDKNAAESYTFKYDKDGNPEVDDNDRFSLYYSPTVNDNNTKRFFESKDDQVVANMKNIAQAIGRGIPETKEFGTSIWEAHQQIATKFNERFKQIKDLKDKDPALYHQIMSLENDHLNNEISKNSTIITREYLKDYVSQLDAEIGTGRHKLVESAHQTFRSINDRFLKEGKGDTFLSKVEDIYNNRANISDLKDMLTSGEYANIQDAFKVLGIRNRHNGAEINQMLKTLSTDTIEDVMKRTADKKKADEEAASAKRKAETEAEVKENNKRKKDAKLASENKDTDNISSDEEKANSDEKSGINDDSDLPFTGNEDEIKSTPTDTPVEDEGAHSNASEDAEPEPTRHRYNIHYEMGDDNILKYKLSDYDESNKEDEHIELVPVKSNDDENGELIEITDPNEINDRTIYEVRSTSSDGLSEKFIDESRLFIDASSRDGKRQVVANPVVELTPDRSISVKTFGIIKDGDKSKGTDIYDGGNKSEEDKKEQSKSNISSTGGSSSKSSTSKKVSAKEKADKKEKQRKNSSKADYVEGIYDGVYEGSGPSYNGPDMTAEIIGQQFAPAGSPNDYARMASDINSIYDASYDFGTQSTAEMMANVITDLRKAFNTARKTREPIDIEKLQNRLIKDYNKTDDPITSKTIKHLVEQKVTKFKNEIDNIGNQDLSDNVEGIIDNPYDGKKSTKKETEQRRQSNNKDFVDAVDSMLKKYVHYYDLPKSDNDKSFISTRQLFEWVNKETHNPFSSGSIYNKLREYLLSEDGQSKYIITDIGSFNKYGDSLRLAIDPTKYKRADPETQFGGDRLNTASILLDLKGKADKGDKDAKTEYDKTTKAIRELKVGDEIRGEFTVNKYGYTYMDAYTKDGARIGHIPVPLVSKDNGRYNIKYNNVWEDFTIDEDGQLHSQSYDFFMTIFKNALDDEHNYKEGSDEYNAVVAAKEFDRLMMQMNDPNDTVRKETLAKLRDNYWTKRAIFDYSHTIITDKGTTIVPLFDVRDGIDESGQGGEIIESKLNDALNHVFGLWRYASGNDPYDADKTLEFRKTSLEDWYFRLNSENDVLNELAHDRAEAISKGIAPKHRIVIDHVSGGEVIPNLSEGEKLQPVSKGIAEDKKADMKLVVGDENGKAEASGYAFADSTPLRSGLTAVMIDKPDGTHYFINAYSTTASGASGEFKKVTDAIRNEIIEALRLAGRGKTQNDKSAGYDRLKNFLINLVGAKNKTHIALLGPTVGDVTRENGKISVDYSHERGDKSHIQDANPLKHIMITDYGNDFHINDSLDPNSYDIHIFKYNTSKDGTVKYVSPYIEIKKNGKVINRFYLTNKNKSNKWDYTNGNVSSTVDIKEFADVISDYILDNSGINLSRDFIRADNSKEKIGTQLAYSEGGKFHINIGNNAFEFDSFGKFVLDNDGVQVNTRVENGSNSRLIGKKQTNNFVINYGVEKDKAATLYKTEPPVEEHTEEEKGKTESQKNDLFSIKDDDLMPQLSHFLLRHITNLMLRSQKGEVDFGQEIGELVQIRLKGTGVVFNLNRLKSENDKDFLPKKIIFDANLNATEDRAGINGMYNNKKDYNTTTIDENGNKVPITVKHGDIVVGQTWLNLFKKDPAQALRKLAHEQVHKNLDELEKDTHTKVVSDLRGIFNEFQSAKDWIDKNDSLSEQNKKDLKDVIDNYKLEKYRDKNGDITQEGLEEFLVESLTAYDLHNALNIIDRQDGIKGTKTHKVKNLLQKILDVIAKAFGWGDIRQGSLLEKEYQQLNNTFKELDKLAKKENIPEEKPQPTKKPKIIRKGETKPEEKTAKVEEKNKEQSENPTAKEDKNEKTGEELTPSTGGQDDNPFGDLDLGLDALSSGFDYEDRGASSTRQEMETSSLDELNRKLSGQTKGRMAALIESGLISVSCA